MSYLIRRYPTDEWYELIRCGRDEVSIREEEEEEEDERMRSSRSGGNG